MQEIHASSRNKHILYDGDTHMGFCDFEENHIFDFDEKNTSEINSIYAEDVESSFSSISSTKMSSLDLADSSYKQILHNFNINLNKQAECFAELVKESCSKMCDDKKTIISFSRQLEFLNKTNNKSQLMIQIQAMSAFIINRICESSVVLKLVK